MPLPRVVRTALVAAALLLPVVHAAQASDERPTPLVAMTDPVQLARLMERSRLLADIDLQSRVAQASLAATWTRVGVAFNDRERRPDPNACTLLPCVGDPRLSSFDAQLRKAPVLFTARSGATLSGNVWAAREGPPRRPLIVMLNGSLIDFEQAHWPQAMVLAKAGYVVLTFDPQGEGSSDQFGEGVDRLDSVGAGLPGLPHNGRPFYDGLVDALDFALSTPARPYRPVLSSGSGTSHAAKQVRRVGAGLNAGHNPLWRLVDQTSVGVIGYSYGAVAASYVGQDDQRIDAVVALDSLCFPVDPSPDEVSGLFLSNPTSLLPGVVVPLAAQIPTTCFGAPQGTAPRPRVPSLGISADFVLPGLVQSTWSGSKAAASRLYSRSGVDSGQVVIQGGSHADFVFVGSIPTLPARLRGLDLSIWFSLAWFDKYLRGLPDAEARLTSATWREDVETARVDPVGDGNLYSQLFDSRLSITLRDGTRWTCDDLRAGCPGQRPGVRTPPGYLAQLAGGR